MEKFARMSYTIRIIAFMLSFPLLFLMLATLLHLKPMFYVFLVLYILYVLNTIRELFSKKESYKNDLIYNYMQIGIFLYYCIIFYRIRFSYVTVNMETMTYFNVNFIILSFLIIFILGYSFGELRKK